MTGHTLRPSAQLLAAALLVMTLGACGDSGCGEPEKQKAGSSSGGLGSSGASSGGGGSVSVGPKAQQVINGPLRKDADAPKAAKAPKSETARPEVKTAISTAAIFVAVTKADYEAKVVKALGKVLVVSYTPSCKGWKDLEAALKGTSDDLAGQVVVYRLNVTAPGQATVLPAGMTRLPVPGFAYYESGQVRAQRQSLPFDRWVGRKGEPIEDSQQYQDRLRRWLREALAAKDFSLPEPKPKY
ncbi:MAG: hypothetical protein PHF00_05030 [Elusimicrobia bacterium]|nr:hypothetical protein [Elusimicrobiota bacterium]